MNKIMFRKVFHFLCLTVLIFSGFICLAQEPARNASTIPNAPAAAAAPYRITVGDELEVKSFYNPELDEKVAVRPDGKISLPLIQEIVAAGKTPEELANELTQKYSAELRQPQVSVLMRTFAGQRVYVAGEVNKAGLIPLAGPLTVLQAVAASEGFTGEARLDEVYVIRRGEGNRPTVAKVDLKAAIHGDVSQDILLTPFDVVYVPRSRIANVNRWVDQYIRKNIPVDFTFAYRLDPSAVNNP
jgi:protein involved in polysaccharide export with SLBB domain